MVFFRLQGEDGNIIDGFIPKEKDEHTEGGYQYIYSDLEPNYCGHKNTVETDHESSLVQAIYKYVKKTGNTNFLQTKVGNQTVAERMEMSMQFLLDHRWSDKFGLIYGATTADWGDVQHTHPWGVFITDDTHFCVDIYDNALGRMISIFESNTTTGAYMVSLPSGRNYGFSANAKDYLFHSENLIIPPTTSVQEIYMDMLLHKVKVGSKIILKNIFFDFDKTTLRPTSTAELDRLTKMLNDIPTLTIEISGHTDNVGSDEYNKILSEGRAKSVVNYLVEKGINKERLTYAGYGEAEPIATNDTEEGRQMNRRTEFKVLRK